MTREETIEKINKKLSEASLSELSKLDDYLNKKGFVFSKIEKAPVDLEFVKNVLGALNKKLNKKKGFSHHVEKYQKCIMARRKEGATYEDFIIVINSKYNEWFGDSYWDTFLRPETLFGTKFQGYLVKAVGEKKEEIKPKEHDIKWN